MKLAVEPPDVNRSEYMFTVDGERTVVYGLGAIKGVGEGAIEGIVAARAAGGPFADLVDFCRRIDLRRANRRVLEALIRAGALDRLGANRATLMVQLPYALKMAEQHAAMQAAGQDDLFGMAVTAPVAADSDDGVLPGATEEWDDDQRLAGEKETLGLFLTGHPIDFYANDMNRLVSTRIARLGGDDLREPRGRRGGRKVMVAGMVVAVSRRNTQNGPMASVLLDDKTGRIEATLFSQVYERFRDEIANDRVLVVEGTLVRDEYRGGLGVRADGVSSLEAVRIARAAVLELALDQGWVAARGQPEAALQALREVLEPARGGACEVRLRYRRRDAEAVLRLGANWSVRPTDTLLRQAQRLLGSDGVTVHFAPAVREAGAAPPEYVH